MGRLAGTIVWFALAAAPLSAASTAALAQDAPVPQPAPATAPRVTTGVAPIDALIEARRLLAAEGAARNPARAALILEDAVNAGIVACLVPLGDLYRRGDGVEADPARAEALYQEALAAGNVRDAAMALGLLYQRGPLRDPEKAIASFERASAAGSTVAPAVLGAIYQSGDGVPADAARARFWYEVALSAGNEADGAYGLGQILRFGPQQDGPAALAYFERALAAGNQEALVQIGRMYRRGDGIPADPAKAEAYFQRALVAGFQADAAYGLGMLYRRDPLRAPRLAVGYLGLAAAVGNDAAMVELGEMYRLGDGIDVNPIRAKDYYDQAIAAGNVRESSYGLAQLYRSGPLRDPPTAVAYFRAAIDAGLPAARIDLADMYRLGDGIAPDPVEAEGLYEQALADGDVAKAGYGLGQLFRAGPLADGAKALEALQWAADAGSVEALVALGDLYRTGDLIPFDAYKAKDFYERAMLGGSTSAAAYGLGVLYRNPPLRDPSAALGYLEVAVGAGSADAMIALADMYRLGDGVDADAVRASGLYNQATEAGATGPGHRGLAALALAPVEGRDPATALIELQAAVDAGDVPALAALGDLYRTGDGVTSDPEKARGLYQQAIDGGAVADGALGLARLSAAGPDPKQAVGFYEQAQAAGSTEAAVALGDIWRAAGDTRKAKAAYEQALAAGVERDAAYGLGELYRPAGGLRDPAKALEYLTRAVEAGSVPALLALGDVYRTGEGVAPDPASAIFLYQKAVEAGEVADGAYGLGLIYAADGPLHDPGAASENLARAAAAGSAPAALALAGIEALDLGSAATREAMIGHYRAAAGSFGGAAVAEAILDEDVRTVGAIVQALLAANGFDPGPIDGAPGRLTATAIEGFCGATGLQGCTIVPPFSPELIAALVEKAPG